MLASQGCKLSPLTGGICVRTSRRLVVLAVKRDESGPGGIRVTSKLAAPGLVAGFLAAVSPAVAADPSASQGDGNPAFAAVALALVVYATFTLFK